MRFPPQVLLLVVIAAIWFLGAIVRFLRDLVKNARAVGTGGARGMAAMDRAIAIADLFAMAVLADGQVTDPKRKALAAALKSGNIDIEPGEAINRLRLRTPELKQPERLSAAIASAAASLSMPDRGDALLRIAAIARAGAGILVQGGYRDDQRADTRALVEIFVRALGVSEEQRAAAMNVLSAP
jgi:hypothetical protein